MRAIVIFFFSSAMLLAALGAEAQASFVTKKENTLFTFDWHHQGQPKVAVRPSFPDAEREAGATGYVDVAIDVGNGGYLQGIRTISSQPSVPAFEQSVRDALAKWEFFVFIDRDCNPQAAASQFRFTFLNKDGEARVTMARVDEPAPPADNSSNGAAALEWVNRNDVISSIPHPPIARRERATAELILRFRVDTATGELKEGKVVAGSSNKPELLPNFIPGADRAARSAIFKVVKPTKVPVATYCQTVTIHD